ncbi:lig [Symbiodinium necroappetens]|uniref:Lig protein n=1 Tax=Symbiodinium necroappetens TaxID=1628268 RepID=A0A812JKQ0_9DINO|nr:lig [Symbiodinium necroappetens]
MGGAQASLCCCFERQKLPREFSQKPPPRPPHTDEPATTPDTAAGGEEDEELEFELTTNRTFLEYRETRSGRKRSRSVPRNFRPCRQRVEAAETGNIEANVGDELRQLPTLPPMDSPFEPFLTHAMVATDRVWRREVLGRMAWRKVPARPHCCANTCQECCQLWNESWRLAACAAARIPGQADPCRDLEILPLLPEEDDECDE